MPDRPKLPERNSKWIHLKTGGVYEVKGIGIREYDNVWCVLYQKPGHGDDWVWIRPVEEFLDGRFERQP